MVTTLAAPAPMRVPSAPSLEPSTAVVTAARAAAATRLRLRSVLRVVSSGLVGVRGAVMVSVMSADLLSCDRRAGRRFGRRLRLAMELYHGYLYSDAHEGRRDLPDVVLCWGSWEPSTVAKPTTAHVDTSWRAKTAPRISDLLRLPTGPVDLNAFVTRATPGFTDSGKSDAIAAIAHLGPRLTNLQEQLYAEGNTGGHRDGRRCLLLVLQGMDTAGKGGTVKHVLGLTNPMGVQYHAFKKPTTDELEHHFLWRVKRRLPPPGIIGVFDRSHYEDVVVVRVQELVPPERWSRRYDAINRFERKLTASGTRVVKCFLHISKKEQRKRLIARLDDPTKRWKYDPADVDHRAYWNDYQQAYADALEKCNSEVAPWHVVPADHKWYRNWAITRILVEQLEEMALTWPVPESWNPEEQLARLAGHPRPAPR